MEDEKIDVNRYVFPKWCKKFPGIQLQHFNTKEHINYLRWLRDDPKNQKKFNNLPLQIRRQIIFKIGK